MSCAHLSETSPTLGVQRERVGMISQILLTIPRIDYASECEQEMEGSNLAWPLGGTLPPRR